MEVCGPQVAASGCRRQPEAPAGPAGGNGWLVSWCIGHLVGLAPADAYDSRYSKWNYADLPILPEPWQFQVLPDTKKQFETLKSLMNRADVSKPKISILYT